MKKKLEETYGGLVQEAIISCIRDISQAGPNGNHSSQCGRWSFGVLPQDQRLRHPCRRFDKLGAAFGLRHAKGPASVHIMMQSMMVPLAVRP